ncbi:hypothetical protein BCR32DRAFT_246373 [Anaeromyces robustus]|uniref:Uncharacterized protein n=1 Tax=Anaeromyces robustus TaxID=1754192 RepID=A0A1Y1X0V3_9FUNG|nr:hypothetical protein BCR32DRAFT_246373 [Anaeromyces robustus]|eukprot:ORX79439.1 hypothetical protein BCR32DRAFT_246373 [Anaeromyces robustus]
MSMNNQETAPPEYTSEPSYVEAPYDNNKKDYNHSIGLPDHEIIVTENLVLLMVIVFYDSEGNEQFSFGEKGIFHKKNIPVLNVFIDEFCPKYIYIYKGTQRVEIYADIDLNSRKDNEVMIGAIKILNLVKSNIKFTVEIAPMVDIAFILGLTSSIVKLMYIRRNRRKHSADNCIIC